MLTRRGNSLLMALLVLFALSAQANAQACFGDPDNLSEEEYQELYGGD